MAKSTSEKEPTCNVVHCNIEKNNNVVLSLRCKDAWFYITADSKDFANSTIRDDYEAHVEAARDRQDYVERVRQGKTELRDKQELSNGVEYRREEAKDSDSGYSSLPSSPVEQRQADEGATGEADDEVDDEVDDEERLHAWMQAPLKDIFARTGSKTASNKSLSISQWYEANIYMYKLKCDAERDTVEAEAREDLDGLAYIRQTLTPSTKMPKYITGIPNLRWFSPAQVQVQAESHDIHLSIHPTLVDIPSGEHEHRQICFLKIASPGDESAVKREIKFLNELEKRDLYDKGINAPKLVGLVSLPSEPDGKTHILGFLISLIPQPAQPLTEMMTTEVEQSKRDRWAKEADGMVALLHDHDMTWGDAKADNFMVDKDEKLWIIDFGGSYTPGWIEPNIADTQEGDDMGTEKIVNGLHDPENCTFDEDELAESDEANAEPDSVRVSSTENTSQETDAAFSSKRKRAASEEDAHGPRKRQANA